MYCWTGYLRRARVPLLEHRRGEDARLARVLRLVQRRVRALEERLRVVALLQLRDARGDAELRNMSDRTAGDRALDPAIQLLRLSDPRLRQHDRELVAADAARDVRAAHRAAQTLGRLREHRVAREVADAFRDRLEVVD